MNEIAEIDFHGDRILAVMDHSNNDIFAPVKPICANLGLTDRPQRDRIQRHPVLSEGGIMMILPSKSGDQKTFCLRQDLLPLWLATVDISRVRPELKEKLYLYQKEAAKVLANHFFKKPEPVRSTENKIGHLYQLIDSMNNANSLSNTEKRDYIRQYHERFGFKVPSGKKVVGFFEVV